MLRSRTARNLGLCGPAPPNPPPAGRIGNPLKDVPAGIRLCIPFLVRPFLLRRKSAMCSRSPQSASGQRIQVLLTDRWTYLPQAKCLFRSEREEAVSTP